MRRALLIMVMTISLVFASAPLVISPVDAAEGSNGEESASEEVAEANTLLKAISKEIDRGNWEEAEALLDAVGDMNVIDRAPALRDDLDDLQERLAGAMERAGKRREELESGLDAIQNDLDDDDIDGARQRLKEARAEYDDVAREEHLEKMGELADRIEEEVSRRATEDAAAQELIVAAREKLDEGSPEEAKKLLEELEESPAVERTAELEETAAELRVEVDEALKEA
ncbi:MAG: hypothetical protein ACLFT2_01675, partial [Candidatus Brocadiia bacterium]